MHNILNFTRIVFVVVCNYYYHHKKLRLYKSVQALSN